MQQTVLPTDYYLTNFRQLTDFVVSHYAHLLGDESLNFYKSLTALPLDAQKLYVRLLLRKGRYFRRSKLSYGEITSLDMALNALEVAGLVTLNAPDPNVTLLKLFTKSELVDCFADPALKLLGRAALDEALQQRSAKDLRDQLLGFIQHQPNEQLIQLCRDEHFLRFRILFFGNLHQDMTDFVLRDLGLNRYETYPLDAEYAALQTPEQVDSHLLYYHYCEQDEALDSSSAEDIAKFLNSLISTLFRAAENDSVLRRRVDRLLLKYARQLERLNAPVEALAVYQKTDRPPSRERQVRLLAEQKRFSEAMLLGEQILTTSTNEEEREFAQGFVPRLLKKAAKQGDELASIVASTALEPATLKVAKYAPPTEMLSLPVTGLSVEESVAAYYSPKGACYFVENTLINAIFGLALWDVVFAPVKGAFYHPFQVGPADLYEDFAHNRQAQLQQFWQSNTHIGALCENVLTRFRLKHGIANSFVHWPVLDESMLTLALARIPYEHWQVIFERILLDIRYHRSGFPDLIWFPDAGGYELIEVKAPNDKIQQNQRRWMAYFHRHNIPHRLVNVQWQ